MVKKTEIKVKKIIIIAIIFQLIFMPISNAGFWDDVKNTGEQFITEGSNAVSSATSSEVDQDELDNVINKIYNLLLALGVVLSVLIGAALGIKFMVGSIEQQAKIKEMLVPYITGCVVTFGAFGIWKILMVILGTL